MFYVIKYVYNYLRCVYKEHEDPRTIHLPLVGSPLQPLAIIGIYLLFVLHYGPKWMANRKPYDLKYVMRVYNAIQVIANAVLIIVGLPNTYMRKEFSLTCQPVDTTITEPYMMTTLYCTYGYYLTKYLDLLDTVFFVLRKKNRQITFLHIYHHAGMVFGVFIAVSFLGGSHATMLGLINLFVHTVMYSYYFVTSMKPQAHHVWWKRYITLLQLLQFGYLFIHFLMPMVRNTCGHPFFVSFVAGIQNCFMFLMFFDFYYNAYIKKKAKTEEPQVTSGQPQQVNGTKGSPPVENKSS